MHKPLTALKWILTGNFRFHIWSRDIQAPPHSGGWDVATLLTKQWALNKPAATVISPFHTCCIRAIQKWHFTNRRSDRTRKGPFLLAIKFCLWPGPQGHRATDHQVPCTGRTGKWGSLAAAQGWPLVYRWVFVVPPWLCVSCSMCANLLMRLAHISICLMNCYRIHSVRFAGFLVFIYSLCWVICRRLSFDLERLGLRSDLSTPPLFS